MKKRNKINIIFTMLIIIFGLFLCSIVRITQLKHENRFLKELCVGEEVNLVPCYLCGGAVKIHPVNESFYIDCDKCELKTDLFNSKSDLIAYWNKE